MIAAAGILGLASSLAISGVFYPDGATTLHFAFEGSPNGDRPIVRPPAFYHADDGFGFVDSPGLAGIADGVVAPRYFRFDVNLPEGNYDVGVTLGGTETESITTVKAEDHRPMLLDVSVLPYQNARKTFTVNVRRGPEGQATLDADGCLNLEFVGSNPSLMKLDIKPNVKAVTVFIAGDSMACDQESIPLAGWGQMLPILFKSGEVAVSNQAVPNATAQSFIEEKRLDAITKSMKSGDYLFVEFGANDVADHTLDAAKWKGFLKTYVDEARNHGANVVLITPPPKLQFDADGKIQNTLVDFPQWMRDFATEQNVPLIDLNAKATTFLETLGRNAGTKAFADDSNLSAYGAFEMAKLVAMGIQEQKLDLAAHLTGDIATIPDPDKFPVHLGFEDDLHK
jgi:lysophospholipase L1-like esterase